MRLKKVGDCRILDQLGEGGMATVYRALHEPLQREVAIKELPSDVAKNKEARSRFLREGMALATFHHQHIVTCYDLIEKNDGWYLVMELVDGPTLGELLKDGPLPAPVAALIGLQVASALEHAHFHRLVHRDLKPANIMVSKWGDTKLMDFGIAQAGDLDRLTQTGLAVGTPSYMSPEQIAGEEVDGRSDVYSLGVVLYEALSGQKAFTGGSTGEVFARITQGKVAPLRSVASVPKPLAAVVAKAMKVKPSQRYKNASELRRALEIYVDETLDVAAAPALVAFLLTRGKLTETEALARLSQTELTALAVLRPKSRKSTWPTLLLAGSTACAAGATWPWWWPRVHALLSIALHR